MFELVEIGNMTKAKTVLLISSVCNNLMYRSFICMCYVSYVIVQGRIIKKVLLKVCFIVQPAKSLIYIVKIP